MDCEQALALISARLDRECTPSENAWLSEHLRGCGACRATAEAFALQQVELRETFEPRRAAVVATVDRVNATVTGRRRAPRRWRLPTHPGVYLAAAVVGWVVVAVIWHFALTTPSTPVVIPQKAPLTMSVPTTATAQGDRLTPRALALAPTTTPLKEGQTVTTAAGERRRELLPNGATVYLNENSALTVTEKYGITLEAGTAYFESAQHVSGQPIAGLVVATTDRYVLAEGTKFAIQKEPQGTRLLAVEGNLAAGNIKDQTLNLPSFVLHAGETLAPQSSVAAPSPRLSHVLDWTRDLIAASETPLVPASSFDGGALIAVDANGQEAKLSLRKYHVDVHLEDGFARTTIDQTYFNHHPWRLEGTFYFPLPPDASLSRLAMYVNGELNEGGMVDRDYGRTVYQRIVNNQRDPALLEWVDGSTFKMRVFPLEGRQEKRIVLSYTQRVPTLYGRSQYRFPAGHNLQTVRDWSFHALVKNGANYAATSPTHPGMKRGMQGGDLVLDDAAEDCKVDRDVVLELTDPAFVAEDKDAVRFSRADLDGNEYLMMRYRPQLPVLKQRQRRDWIFLYETSADRDPLLARAQIEVIRGMLQNAEHDDTFCVLPASNDIRQVVLPAVPSAPSDEVYVGPATPDNVAAVLGVLEHTHLVGALDLGNAFRKAERYAKLSSNPYLVHVGGGYTGMGTPQDELLKFLPPNAKYIGVGVGKHWDRAFMKQCAEKTGGYYTQINPDESISWRTFDLMATLNTPRLLDIKVAAARQQQAADENGPRFLLDNSAIAQGEELCAVTRLRRMPDAVTITGLLDGEPFERTVRVENITTKAAYIPRTWAKLEIDRLLAENPRENKNSIVELSKAMYVMTPFTSLLVLENEAMYKEFKVERGRKDHWAMYPCPDKIPVVYEPDPTMPTDVRNAPKGLKPTANEVLQTVCVRVSPTWLLAGQQQSEQRQRLRTGAEVWSYSGEDALTDLSNHLGDWREEDGKLDLAMQLPKLGKVSHSLMNRGERSKKVNEFGLPQRPPLMRGAENFRQIQAFILDDRASASRNEAVDGTPLGVERNAMDDFYGYALSGLDTNQVRGLNRYDALRSDAQQPGTFPEEATPSSSSPVPLERKTRRAIQLGREFSDPAGREHGRDFGLLADGLQSAPSRGQDSLLYQRLHYSADPRLFTDLLNYAPGLNTSEADILAVLDAEAMPDLRQAPGRIDPAARHLIDGARTGGWRKLTLPGDREQPDQVILFDGGGRYAYERTPKLGLHELVVCNGTTLVQQYPEIGLAGRRTVSRFHRAEFAGLLPWLLPPAEDLARGVDLECVDVNTIALVPHWLRDVRPSKQETPQYVQVHLLFQEGRFVERRLLEMPANKIVARELYDNAGGVTLLDRDGKEVSKLMRKLSDAAAPNLRPDLSAFVVLSLPYRSRAHVMEKAGLNAALPLSADDNGCFEYLDADTCLNLLTAVVAEQNAAEAQLLYRRCFHERGDRRRGLFALLAATGVEVNREPGLRERFAATPDDELLQYVALSGNRLYQYAQQRLVLNRSQSAEQGGSFLRQLLDAQALLWRWDAPRGRMISWNWRQGDVRRTSAFLGLHSRDVLGLALLYQMQDRTQAATDAERERRQLTFAAQWGRVAEANDGDYRARYEEACSLDLGNKRPEAATLLQALYARSLKAGVLPPIDGRFKDALQSLEKQPVVDAWNPLLRATARQFLAEKKYAAVIALASQCRSLGEPALADTLLADLLAAVQNLPAGWRTKLAVVQFYAQANELARADALLQELLPVEELLTLSAPGVSQPGATPAVVSGSPLPFGVPPRHPVDEKLAQAPALWRLASQLAERRGMEAKALACLEKALALEYEHLPDTIALQSWRSDYGKLLGYYLKLAHGARTLNAVPPPDLLERTIRAVDRWRAHDPEAAEACKQAADVCALLGERELAWDYYTTWMIGKGVDVGRWQSVAVEMNQLGAYQLADRALAVATDVEPTNAEVVWQRAQNLRQAGKGDEADRLTRRLANETWPERYQGIRSNAQYSLNRR